MSKYRILPKHNHYTYFVVEEKKWYGWEKIGDFNVTANGSKYAYKKAEEFIKTLKKNKYA